MDTLEEKYEKLFGKSATSKQEVSTSEGGSNVLSLIALPFSIVVFVLRLFIFGPSKEMANKNYVYHAFNGIFITLVHAYLIFNLTEIEPIFESLFDKDTLPMAKGLFAIYCLVQVFRGAWLGIGSNYYGNHITKVDAKRFSAGHRHGTSNSSPSYRGSNSSETSKMFSYMESKMVGMSNSQKESYMSKFYGGKN